jgi:predicted molibdopterin-dependent oxidoreductase YjgC
MANVTLSIDGNELTVAEGSTILAAAEQAGVHIPTLCHDPDLTPYAGCRLCIVKIEGMRGMPPSCAVQVTAGMKVTTEDDEIYQTRKMVLRLLLADHGGDCLACRANMNCKLQKLAADFGLHEHGLDKLPIQRTVDESNPVFVRDMNRCILCGRCVKTCQEIVGLGAIDFIHRGHQTEVGPFLGGDIEGSVCESCGECVEHCPTGALSYKNFLPEAEKEISSICPYCGVGCGIQFGLRRGKVVRARGDRDNPVNRGNLCVKGRFGSYPFVHDKKRLTRPLLRKDGVLQPASWDEALDLVAKRLSEYRGDAFAAFASAKVANEDNYLFQKFTRAVMGTNSVDHCARL